MLFIASPIKKIVLIALFVRTDLLRFLYETLAPLSKNKKKRFYYRYTTANTLNTTLVSFVSPLPTLCASKVAKVRHISGFWK